MIKRQAIYSNHLMDILLDWDKLLLMAQVKRILLLQGKKLQQIARFKTIVVQK